MYKISKAMRCIAICTAIISALSFTCEAVYYTDDTFRNISVKKLSPVSSWDFDESGGNVNYSENSGVILNDTSFIEAVSMNKKISVDENEVFTLETVFTLNKNAEGFSISLMSGDNALCEIKTKPSELVLIGNDAEHKLCAYSPQSKIGVKMTVNPLCNTVTASINGVTYQAAAVAHSQITEIKITTPKSFTMDAVIDVVKAYSNYSLNERFISSCTNVPDCWVINQGTAQVSAQQSASQPDVYSLSLVENTIAQTSFVSVNGSKSRYEFRFMSAGNAEFSWIGNSGNIASITVQNGAVSLNGTVAASYNSEVWQRIELEVDNTTNTASLMQNGKYIVENAHISDSSITGFCVNAISGNLLLDDISAYEDMRESISLLPPVKAETEATVGMIRCDIWREGNHLGWDYISPYEDTVPYLGYYDDGNPQAADWETKWMVEHGVDFQMNCWFLPKNYEEGPIKAPNNAFAIEDGYFHSQYSDLLDFAIMWENQLYPNITEQSFRENIVPYWVEYYLKDERYLKISNKPVISIYNASNFLSGIGGGNIQTAKENLNYLRNECVKLGYDGAYIVCASNGLSDVANEKAMGFDACHAYCWGDFSGDPQVQKDYLTRASQNAAQLSVLPTVSVGIDEQPWGRPQGLMLEPTDFESILSFVNSNEAFRDVNTMGKIVLCDSWNEYGEGHYIMPSQKYGFGYLDAIRDVFAQSAPAHSDIVPTDEQKDKLGTLYPKNREPAPKMELTVPIGTETVREWSGETLSEWKINKNISSALYSDGVYKYDAISSDPSLFIEKGLNIDLNNVNYIEVKAKRLASDRTLNVYYTTSENEIFTQAKSAYVNAQKDGQWHTYYIPMWKQADFCGTLYKLRLDVINSVGSFEVESIKLLRGMPGDRITWNISGNTVSPTTPLMRINGEIYAEYREIADQFDVKTAYLADLHEVRIVTQYDIFRFSSNGMLYKNDEFVKEYSPICIGADSYAVPLEAVADILQYNMSYSVTDGSLNMTCRKLFPEITYNSLADSDENGLWKYRELTPDPSCENVESLWVSSDTGSVSVSNTVFHSGAGSICKVFSGAYKPLGVEGAFKPNTEYHLGVWMKNESTTDETPAMRIAADYDVYDEAGLRLGHNQKIIAQNQSDFFALDTNWSYVSRNVRITMFTGGSTQCYIGNNYSLQNQRIYFTKADSAAKSIYMDDLSIREVPPFNVYTKKISHHDGQRIGKEDIVFTFSHDIDPWTVTPDKILINGENGDGRVETEIKTDEVTRETRLVISLLRIPTENENITVSLDHLQDAWGREVIGESQVSVVGGGLYSDASFSENNEEICASFNLHGVFDSCTAVVCESDGSKISEVSTYKLTKQNSEFSYNTNKNGLWKEIYLMLIDSVGNIKPVCEKAVFTKEFILGSVLN